MPRKADLQQIDAVARKFGLDRHKFGAFIEDCKRHGDTGTLNDRGDFTWDELVEKAQEFMDQ